MSVHWTPQQLKKAAALLDLMEPESGRKDIGFKHDLSPATGVAPYGHGAGGLFSQPGQDVNIFSAMMLPRMGLLDELPLMPMGSAAPDDYGGYDSPMYTTVTGVTKGDVETFSNQPNAICDTPPQGGLMKLCTLTAPYGWFSECLRAIELGRVGRLFNRGEPTDLRLLNPPANGGAVIPTFGMGGSPLNIEVQRRMFEAFVSFKRLITPLVYTGTPSANKEGGGGKQFIGMETLVNTGNKVDAISGAICTALNSDVKNFGFNLVNGTGNSIVNYLDTLFGYLEFNASRMGMNPVDWAIVMRPELFDELVKVFPVEQYLYALQTMEKFTNGRVVVDASDATNLRGDMLTNQWLPIRGRRRRVILDDGIPELNVTTAAQLSAGQYASDIYVIPFTVMGGIPVTWFEAFNYDNANLRAVLEMVQNKEAVWTSDGGRFLFFTQRTSTCINVCYRLEPRIIMRTPYLAGRIQNCAYQPLQHFRSAMPDNFYFTDGGVSYRTTGTYYSEYSTTTPVTLPS